MFERFHEVNSTFPRTAQILEHKRQGRPVLGWLCTYVPEEIMHAAGALPVRITGYNREMELEDGSAYLYVNNCSFSRSCLQMGLRGEYEFLDGVIGGSTCDGARRLFDLWRNYIGTPFHHILTVPRKTTPEAHALYYLQVKQFKEHLEEFLGIEITDDSLRQSIEIYNESRSLLGNLYELRKLDNPPITGAETMEVLNASFRMPKELFNQYLKDLLIDLSNSSHSYTSQARVMVTGSVVTNPEFIESIETQGALVVADDICTGTRYWSDPVVLDGNSSALPAISQRYLNNFPCARMFPSKARFDRIVKLARDFRVDGVISQTIRYCVSYAHDLPLLTKRLQAEGIPVLALDVEYGTSGSGQIQTRVQAFLEMLGAKQR
ncbi:MAG: 2-hydroxyacyl-CoA dehydratase family protein [Dehalococcoidia bacterium]|nr:2-hydroxyacyl-CoA dehydratase family protein [Dehalococcoidia bacterium]